MKETYLKKQDKDQILRDINKLIETLTSLKKKHREVFCDFLPSFQEEVIRIGEALEGLGTDTGREVESLERVCFGFPTANGIRRRLNGL